MLINLKEKIGDDKVVILVMPNEKYAEDIIEIARGLAVDYKKACYVNLNRPYSALTNSLKSHGIDDTKRIFFIDGITKTAAEAKEADNCLYINAPNALTQLSLAIAELFKTLKPEILLFDSLSTILIYEKVNTVMKFVHNLIGRIRLSDCTAIFTALEGEAETELMKELKPFVDKVIKL